jgi:hypothetical protein
LHPDWVKLVTKELKGKDPQETLTWKTAEVNNLCKVSGGLDKEKELSSHTGHVG